ncbi:MAG TPA: L-threonylcarbamoyladenylate synthase [Thermoleophilaceae bacterium]|nr:L-threonylcarbamoyladenylate synthase [Thermoleophilaceae bacterium]
MTAAGDHGERRAAGLSAQSVAALERCIASGGVAVFPADTVYGLACDPESPAAVDRLYGLKGRAPDRPAAVMCFSLADALAAVPELGPRTTGALERLMPGPVTAILPNPGRRFPLACGPVPERLGLRVPGLDPPLAPLAALRRPILQSSANRSGGPDAGHLEDVDPSIRHGADLALDAGKLPGTPSTVVDLSRYEDDGSHSIIREGALPADAVEAALGGWAR